MIMLGYYRAFIEILGDEVSGETCGCDTAAGPVPVDQDRGSRVTSR